MTVQPILTAMRLAQALRHLRDLELQDARRYRELRDAGGTARKLRRTIDASHFDLVRPAVRS